MADPTQAQKYLDFFAPELASTEDEKAAALSMAASFIPACLTQDLKDQAQALYAAHLLSLRALQAAGGAGQGFSGVLKSEREGDLQRDYQVSESAISGVGGTPYYDRWNSLWIRCRPAKLGALLTGSQVVVPIPPDGFPYRYPRG